MLLRLLKLRPSLRAVPAEAIWAACLHPNSDDMVAACWVATELEAWGVAARAMVRGAQSDAVAPTRLALQAEAEAAGWAHSVAVALTSGGDSDGGGAGGGDAVAVRRAAITAQLRGAASHAKRVERLQRLLWLRWSDDWAGEAALPRTATTRGLMSSDKDSTLAVAVPPCELIPMDAADGVIEAAPEEVRRRVMESYLPKKLSSYLGIPSLASRPGGGTGGASAGAGGSSAAASNTGGCGNGAGGGATAAETTVIHVPPKYMHSEGKLLGEWEEVARRFGTIDLRVDLQPRLAPPRTTTTTATAATRSGWCSMASSAGPRRARQWARATARRARTRRC